MSRVDLKVVLLGSEYVGKTSLLERYVYDRFRGNVPYQNVCLFMYGYLVTVISQIIETMLNKSFQIGYDNFPMLCTIV